MSKSIIIIGAGISGLALLHYLREKYSGRADIVITLLEKDARPGGTIQSIIRDGYLFETGPNGFLDSKPRTLQLAHELNLTNELIQAQDSAKKRYLALQGVLYPFPTTPAAFLGFKPFGWRDKARVLGEIFVPGGEVANESVYDFGARRFGKRFADLFLDPMVSGIYGGDAKEIVLQSAFPRMVRLEKEFGSLFKAMIALKKKSKGASSGMPAGKLTSFRRGQGQLIAALAEHYPADIRLNEEVKTVTQDSGRYIVTTTTGFYEADELFISTPAPRAGAILRSLDPALAKDLEEIHYAPMAVVGLVFSHRAFEQLPQGFGYLIPSSEGKEVLGVLFESNIFPARCRPQEICMRVMIGGARHPEILEKSTQELTELAIKEIQMTLGAGIQPRETFFMQWAQAIPQYDRTHIAVEQKLEEKLKRRRGLYLVANYRKGASMNDCIENAFQAAQSSGL